MLILHDPRCADYGSSLRPEQPARVVKTADHLRKAHPAWSWRVPAVEVTDQILGLAHSPAHLRRLMEPRDFDGDTPYFPDIADHARRGVAAALEASRHALATREPIFSLMRPPGHHATSDRAMGFCYLNSIAIAALAVQRDIPKPDSKQTRAHRVAVWDFDAHHGNGTEAILHGRSDLFYASVHQYPGYPGSDTRDQSPNVRNWPVQPYSPRADHMAAIRASLDAVVSFAPDLILVSAGFDAYVDDPITSMTLEHEDFALTGRWLGESALPAAAILEGGYSDDLPLLIDVFLSAWENVSLSA
jgi:acetoin utilization deacetylase AcuC-like enzyme